MALPSRTLHFGSRPSKGGRGHWNLQIPYPALAFTCREALYAVRDTLHEINGNQVFNISSPKIAPAPSQNRTRWITTADTLSICHDIRDPEVRQTLLLYRPVLPHFANVAITLDALHRAVKYPKWFTGYRICAEDVRSMRRIQVVVQTVMFFVPNGWGRLREKFPQDEVTMTRRQETGFEDFVSVIDPEDMGDWSGLQGDKSQGMYSGERLLDGRHWKHYQTRYPTGGGFGVLEEGDREFEDVARCQIRGDRLDWMSSMHRTTVVDLYDRARLRELFEFAKAFRPEASESGQDRLDAILDNPKRAFCVDCLIQWWEKRGSRIAEDAVAGIKPQSEEDMQKWPRDVPVAPEEALPTIVPAVQFCFRFKTEHRALAVDLRAS